MKRWRCGCDDFYSLRRLRQEGHNMLCLFYFALGLFCGVLITFPPIFARRILDGV